MFIVVTISNVGTDVTGPFDLFSDVDGYVSAFAYNVSLAELTAGYSVEAPDGTTTVRIQVNGQTAETPCSYFVVDTLVPTTTTTTTATPTTTTTTTTV